MLDKRKGDRPVGGATDREDRNETERGENGTTPRGDALDQAARKVADRWARLHVWSKPMPELLAERVLDRAARHFILRHRDHCHGSSRFDDLLERLTGADVVAGVLTDVLSWRLIEATGGREDRRERWCWRLDHSPGMERDLRRDLFSWLDRHVGELP